MATRKVKKQNAEFHTQKTFSTFSSNIPNCMRERERERLSVLV
jgi:hypothetical protein